MRLVFISHRAPFPPHKGEKIRALNILKFLGERHEVHLACLVDDAEDLQHVKLLDPYVRSVTVQRLPGRLRKAYALSALVGRESVSSRYFHSASLQKRFDALIERERIEGIFCSSSPTAEYVFRSTRRDALRGVPKVMDLIDIDSVKWRHYAQESSIGPRWLYGREARCLARLERRIGREFERALVVSEAERRCCTSIPGNCITVMPNGVDLDYFAPGSVACPVTQERALIFTGVMDYRPNIEGVTWFVRSILPKVRAAVPDVRLYVVGNHPTKAVRRLGEQPGVFVTGFVPDVRQYLARGVCVAPLRIARGIQNKVLEAMAMARPAVVTPQALEGIDAVPGRDVLVAADEEAFAADVVDLLSEPERGAEIGRAARARMQEGYSWSRNLAVLNEVFPGQGRGESGGLSEDRWPRATPNERVSRVS